MRRGGILATTPPPCYRIIDDVVTSLVHERNLRPEQTCRLAEQPFSCGKRVGSPGDRARPRLARTNRVSSRWKSDTAASCPPWSRVEPSVNLEDCIYCARAPSITLMSTQGRVERNRGRTMFDGQLFILSRLFCSSFRRRDTFAA